MSLIVTISIMIALLFLKGFFSGSEIALVSADKIKLRHQASMGNKGAKKVLEIFKTPEVFLGTTLVGTNIATVSLTTLGTLLMVELVNKNADLYSLLIYSPIFLIFGEIVPKSIYQQYATYISTKIISILKFFTFVFYPVIFIFSRIARFITYLSGVEKADSSLFISREQIHSLVEMSEMVSNIDVFDRYRIKRALRFSEVTVGQTMTPAINMVALDRKTSLENAVRLAKSMEFSDIPVYQNNINNISGILSLTPWDILTLQLDSLDIDELIKPACFVSENQYLQELFELFELNDCATAIVVDEFGSCIGMIKKQDLYEQVVGELTDDKETQSRRRYQDKMQCQTLPDGALLIDAKLPIAELNEMLGAKIRSKEYFSLGGLVLAHLHHLPRVSETFEGYGYRFTIESMTERAIDKVRVEKII